MKRMTSCALMSIFLLCLHVRTSLSASLTFEFRESEVSDSSLGAGEWGEWGLFTSCDADCGKGHTYRSRECLSRPCSGSIFECLECFTGPCQEDNQDAKLSYQGTWSEWGSFEPCDVSCGAGHKYRYRNCSEANECAGYDYEFVACDMGECKGGWTSWAVSACSKACGDGERVKTRQCVLLDGEESGREAVCKGGFVETVTCNVQTCPLYEGGQCYDPNNPDGYRGDINTPLRAAKCFKWNHINSKYRPQNYTNSGLVGNYCRNPNHISDGPWCYINQKRTRTDLCKVPFCPAVDEVYWNNWSNWSGCSVSCDRGSQTRVRNCKGGSITQGGCLGSFIELRECEIAPCDTPSESNSDRSTPAKTSEQTTTKEAFTTTESTTTTTTTTTTTSEGPVRECGNPVVPIKTTQDPSMLRIIGGYPAPNGSLPWLVTLQRNDPFNYRMCGATIIDKDWVLTAAHCMFAGEAASRYKAVAGSYWYNEKEEGEMELFFQDAFIHERYNPNSLIHDIALLKLTNSITFTNTVKPVCLPKAVHADNFTVGVEVLVAGWGATDPDNPNSFDEQLQQVLVPTVSREDCKKSYRNQIIHDGMICAGLLEDGGKDACTGDSGGPLIYVDNFELLGVVSWGYGCALPNQPGVYSYVPYYMSWITNIMDNN